MTGVSGIVAGGWNVDAASGQDLHLNPEQQGDQFGSGVTAAGMWAATPFITKPAGKEIPTFSEENWSNPELGTQMHEDFGANLADQTGTQPAGLADEHGTRTKRYRRRLDRQRGRQARNGPRRIEAVYSKRMESVSDPNG